MGKHSAIRELGTVPPRELGTVPLMGGKDAPLRGYRKQLSGGTVPGTPHVFEEFWLNESRGNCNRKEKELIIADASLWNNSYEECLSN